MTGSSSATKGSGSRAERLGFRVDGRTKQLVQRAARLEHRKLTEYCVTALTEAARRTIESHEALTLTEQERLAFFDVLVSPAEPNERLRRAFAEERRRVGR